jgi:2-methylcitrate dehydratase
MVALARAVLDFGGRTVAAHQLARAQSLLLDAIGCAILGSHEPTARAMMAAAETSTGPCVLIGRGDHTTVAAAVLANGAAIRVLDFNDYFIGEANGQPEAGGHPSDNIPVALAVAQARGSTGQQLLASIILGYELYWRLQRLMDRAGKWDGVSASGIVAPAIAGFLIGLDEQRLAHAIALGAARAATPSIIRRGGIAAAKSIANAMVAQSGVQAALLAEAGITGPLNILDDPRGLQELFRSPDLLPLTRPISGNATMAAQVKFFPCVNTAQTAVAAAAEVRKAMKHQINEIRAVEIVMADYPMVKRQQEDAQRRSPSSREAADHSLPFVVAVTLIDGALTLVQFADERWRDPAVKCLMEKISMRRDAEWNQRAPGALPCTLRVIANDAREYRTESIHPPQVTLQSVTAKFHGILADVVPYGVRARIVDAVMELHHSPSTAALDAALTNGEAN